MDFNEYQKKALSTDSYNGAAKSYEVTDLAFINKVLGLVGESGEVADKIKKIHRNNGGVMSPDEKQEVIKELGDVLWYLALLAHYLGVDLESVAKLNIDKLADRKARGVIKSKGDNR